MTGRAGAAVRLALWTAVLVGIARLLLAAGSPSLSIPLGSADALSEWVATAAPADMAIGILRLGALGATFYLLAATALTVAAELFRFGRLAAAVERVTPGVVRRIVTGGSGIGLVIGAAVGTLPVPDLGGQLPSVTVASSAGSRLAPGGANTSAVTTMDRVPARSATMTRVADAAAATMPAGAGKAQARTARIADPAPATATMTRLDPVVTGPADADPPPAADGSAADKPAGEKPAGDKPAGDKPAGEKPASDKPGVDEPAVDEPAVDEPPPARPADAAPPPPALPPVDAASWVVGLGDSFWTIAEDVVSESAPGAPVDERAVTRYWRQLIAANRSRLIDPANPDVLVPGQRLIVPPPP